MSEEANIKGLDSRSEEVQELMEAIPSWIQRWGITLIAIIIIGVIILCNNIRIPQKIEIDLTLLKPADIAIIATPSIGKIHEFNFADGTSVSYGDTLLIFEYPSGNSMPILAPISGHVKLSGPLSTNKILPESIELLQIHNSEPPLSYYYGHIKSDYINAISVGDTLFINNNVAKISFISQYPSSTGLYYLEATSPFSGSQTTQISHITIASETILHRLLKKLPFNQ